MRTWRWVNGIAIVLVGAVGCRAERECVDCGTVVIAATGEPRSVLPPLVVETVGRDISDQVYERLADLTPGAAPMDPSSFRPRLAERWERLDERRWRFRLRPDARWHDGRAVTADDVRFSFAAFADSAIGAPARGSVARIAVEVEDSVTFVLRFPAPFPEQLYDATYHVRIIPSHVWDTVPRAAWPGDTSLARLVGTGPYRVAEWRRGEFLRIESAAGDGSRAPAIGQAIWRFAGDPDAAVNLLLSHEADLLETVTSPDRISRLEADPAFVLMPYPAAVYGFLGFRVSEGPLADRAVRRGLARAVDRQTMALAVFGPGTIAPPGPMSQLSWLWSDSLAVLPFDSAGAGRALDEAGWPRGSDGVRRRFGLPLAFEILVPASSASRRRLAIALGDAWRRQGVEVAIAAVDFPAFQQRLQAGRFDAYIGAWLDEPSPRSLADQWTRAGWGTLNHGKYANPRLDTLVARALREADPGFAKRLWREAMDTLNADVPALFLYAPVQRAVVAKRLREVSLDPYRWLSGLSSWGVAEDRGGD